MNYYNTNGQPIRVEVSKNGTIAELTLADGAVTIDYVIDSIFAPLKQSGCSIKVLTKEILDLYTGKRDEIEVRIYRGSSVRDLLWFGYLTPNIYSQEYETDVDLLTLEAIDTIAQLEYIKYDRQNQTMTSFIDIFRYIFDKVDPNKVIRYIVVQDTLSQRLNKLSILERNFYDEEGEPQNMNEVLSDILTYLGLTIVQWEDSYYLFDPKALKEGVRDFKNYNRLDGNYAQIKKDIPLNVVQVAESNCTVSMGDVFNKINVVANTNTINSVLPNAISDTEDIINQNVDPEKYYETTKLVEDPNDSKNNKNYTLLNAFFKSKENWMNWQVSAGTLATGYAQVDEVTGSNIDTVYRGGFWQKSDQYITDEEPSSLNWKSYYTCVDDGNWLMGRNQPMLNLLKKPFVMYKGGYLIIDMKYRFSSSPRSNDVLKTWTWNNHNHKYVQPQYVDTSYTLGYEDTRFPCRLTIGSEYYFDGRDWQTYTELNKKIAAGYFNQHGISWVSESSNLHEATWYKIMQNGYWKYVNQSTYNSFSGTKQTGSYERRLGVYYLDISNAGMPDSSSIFVEESYYHEWLLQDRFYLVRKLEDNELIFDEEKTLTNTVSWRMELAESKDGVAIKIPDKLMIGDFGFDLYAPNHLGTFGCGRTDVDNVCIKAIHISDLNLVYTSSGSVENLFEGKTYDPDILYSSVINEQFVTELDDIIMRVNTYSPRATSYSYVMDMEAQDFVDTMTYVPTGQIAKPEEILMRKYVEHYSTPKLIYENTIVDNEITPFSLFKVANRTMIIGNANYDIDYNCINAQLIEI